MQANWLDLSLCVDLFHHERITFLAEYTGALTYCLKSYCHFLLREVIEPYQLAFPIDLWVPETPTEIEHKDRFQWHFPLPSPWDTGLCRPMLTALDWLVHLTCLSEHQWRLPLHFCWLIFWLPELYWFEAQLYTALV